MYSLNVKNSSISNNSVLHKLTVDIKQQTNKIKFINSFTNFTII